MPLRVRHPDQQAPELPEPAGHDGDGLRNGGAWNTAACMRSGTPSPATYTPGDVEVKIISKLLGHASVEITYNRYIHFFEGDIDDTLRQAVGA